MLYAVEEQQPVPHKEAQLSSIASLQSVTLLKRASIPEQSPQISEVVTLSTRKLLGKTNTISSSQNINLVAINVGPPPISGGTGQIIRATSQRLLQPGNLQASQRLRVNWQHPIANGLVFLEIFDLLRRNDHPFIPQMIGSHGLLTQNAGTFIRPGPGGLGITMSSGTGGISTTSGNQVKIPQAAGSYFSYVTSEAASNDGIGHYITQIGRATGGSEQLFMLTKFSDNQIYFGFQTNGVSYRAILSAVGLWTAGESFVFGGTWDSADTNVYVKGKFIGSKGSPPTAGDTTTATAQYRVAGIQSGSSSWGTTVGKNFVYYIAIWNRALSAAECNYLNQNPYCFLTGPARP